MKAVIILISLFFFFQISLCNTAYRKASILKSFNDFILEKLKSIESSKLIETLSFLAKSSPNENKRDGITPLSESLWSSNWTCTQCQFVMKSLQQFDNSACKFSLIFHFNSS